jgi:hypothetical protein
MLPFVIPIPVEGRGLDLFSMLACQLQLQLKAGGKYYFPTLFSLHMNMCDFLTLKKHWTYEYGQFQRTHTSIPRIYIYSGGPAVSLFTVPGRLFRKFKQQLWIL